LKGEIDPSSLSPLVFQSFLQYPSVPDPDLFLRTSGEFRISNFLLWQIAYSEIVVSPVLWPDFDDNAFVNALLVYAKRERRFGRTGEQAKKLKMDDGELWGNSAFSYGRSDGRDDKVATLTSDEDPTAPKEDSESDSQPQMLRQRLSKPKVSNKTKLEGGKIISVVPSSKSSFSRGFPTPFTLLVTIFTSIATYFILHSLRTVPMPFTSSRYLASHEGSPVKAAYTFPAPAEAYSTSTGRPSAPTANVRKT
jgi:hypothetical protein